MMTLGKYELVRRIGQGGMAEVFLARARSIGGFERLVVLKRLLPALATEPGMLQMFLDEARLAAQLHHTNIGQVFDVDQVQGSVFYAMEYLRGRDLHALAASLRATEQPFPLDQAIAVVTGMCAGLHYAHQLTDPQGEHLSLVHRDVTPHNVVVTFDGGVKVIDFGIAKIAGARLHTQAGQLRGKIRYMSPEQVLQQPLDGRSDVFATAIVLYELITGRRLFDLGDYDALQAIVYKDVPPPSSVNADIPAPLDAILLKGLARDRAARYPTALAMQIELQDFARANRLDLSPLGVAHLMAKVFPDEAAQTTRPILESLREDTGAWALGEDGSIEIEVIEGTATTPERLDALTTQTVPPEAANTKTLPPEPAANGAAIAPARRRPWALIAVLVAVFGAGAGLTGRRLLARATPSSPPHVEASPAAHVEVPDTPKTDLAQQQPAPPDPAPPDPAPVEVVAPAPAAPSHRHVVAKRKKTAHDAPSSVVDKVTVQIQEQPIPPPSPPPQPPPPPQTPPQTPSRVGPDSLFPH